MDDSGALAVVIGRAGSKGLPGKNARTLHGRPMIGYSIDDARRASSVSRTIVSTDGPAIADAARAMGVTVIDRPASLADDTATVADAVRHAVDASGAANAIIVILYANVPVRPPTLIDDAVRLLRDSGADSVQSYTDVGKHHPYWMSQLDDTDRVTPYHPNTIDRRQDLPPLYLPDGGVIAVGRAGLMSADPTNPHAFFGDDRRGVRTAPGAVIDIDDDADLLRAECALAAPGGREVPGGPGS